MGLLPEFFMILGIDIFLAMSLLSALLDDDLPSSLQYLFQGAAVLGLGQLFMNEGLINGGIFGRDPTDPTRFWISVIYLASAVSNVIGLNVYLVAVRRKMTLASAFSGAVTVPTLITSAFFITSFMSGGELTLLAVTMLVVSALVGGLSIFGFLRQASKHISNAPGGRRPSLTGPLSKPPGAPGITLPFRLPAMQVEDWEEASSKEKGRGGEE